MAIYPPPRPDGRGVRTYNPYRTVPLAPSRVRRRLPPLRQRWRRLTVGLSTAVSRYAARDDIVISRIFGFWGVQWHYDPLRYALPALATSPPETSRLYTKSGRFCDSRKIPLPSPSHPSFSRSKLHLISSRNGLDLFTRISARHRVTAAGGVTRAHFLFLGLQSVRSRVGRCAVLEEPARVPARVRESVAAGGAAVRRRRLVCCLWVSLAVLVRQCRCGGGLKFTRIQLGYHRHQPEPEGPAVSPAAGLESWRT
eukprot:5918181-Prymnesium_polylepis.1